MKAITRKENIAKAIEVQKNSTTDSKKFVWRGKLVTQPAYNLKLSDLIYNKYNGRIGSRVKTLEKPLNNDEKIDPSTPEGHKLIDDLLWHSSEPANKKTLKDINRYGQKEVGIVTKDGIIVDGNRRAMVIRRSTKENYFLAVVLDAEFEDERIEIQKLETSVQMGEDEKVTYNPIEKYIRAQEFKNADIPIDDIADYFNVKDTKVEDYLRIMELMDAYLVNFNYPDMYIRLDKREGAFVDLDKWMEQLLDKSSSKGFDGYKTRDVINLRRLCFDYIRSVYENTSGILDWKDLRIIAQGYRSNHIFGSKDLWERFFKDHKNNIDPIIANEDNLDTVINSDDLEKALRSRDMTFSNNTIEILTDNFNNYKDILGVEKYKQKPKQMLQEMKERIKKVKELKNDKNQWNDDEKDIFDELKHDILEIEENLSFTEKLKGINNELEISNKSSVNLKNSQIDKSEIQEILDKIQENLGKLKYKINKI